MFGVAIKKSVKKRKNDKHILATPTWPYPNQDNTVSKGLIKQDPYISTEKVQKGPELQGVVGR